ncbi:hypothetical protein P7L95_09930 [Bisgaard Taxon 10/6]|uniref:hypothetical protein n=1 Tax=Exercitatus varius TaxID=67857 RepID=UPI00294B29E6|nr:hypothetical protein [Exercitatus varius]MDG2957060.1 hypothetical protein [Exercitatus varius]MDG2965252.1 hypothetical protein [Exercitatus varius]
MKQSELEKILAPLKQDLTDRLESRGLLQAIITEHIQLINRCIGKNITISIIHKNIFPDNEVAFAHFKTLIYRARKKLAKNHTKQESGGKTEQIEKTQEITQIEENQSENVFSFLAKKEEKPIHNSCSDQQAVDDRVKMLLMRKKQKEALNEK